ncbi:MAG: hypothetical protein HKN91_17795 [Acidimicrobiia bacterium]|nr:hypothetical protein [Acidimicrobiia bacterium]
MDGALALIAAALASGFAIDLWRSQARRSRFHALAWATAMSLYAIATWTLAWGLLRGWTDTSFRVFYYLGAIVNIPILALGSIALVRGERAGRRFVGFLIPFFAIAAWSTMVAPAVGEVANVGVPEGSAVFQRGMIDDPAVPPIPSPRTFAAIAGGLGTVIVIGLAAISAVRRRSDRNAVLGNVLIILGTLAPAFGGSLTALGEGGAFAISLLVGAALLWAGYRVARRASYRTSTTESST